MLTFSSTVLCVDDDPDDLQFITSIIKEVEPELLIATAADGEDAIAYLQRAKHSGPFPVLILLDFNMPRLNGKQTLALLKSDPVLKSIPVVVFATSVQPSDRLYCTHYGTEMMSKPDSVTGMRSVLLKLLCKALYC